MRKVIKPKPRFLPNVDIDDMISFYHIKYPKGKQLTPVHFVDHPDAIDLSKLDPTDTIAAIRAGLLSTRVWLIESQEDLTKLFSYLDKHDIIAYDTETTNIKLPTHPDVIMWSIAVKVTEAFVVPYKFNNQVVSYLVNTESNVVAHNLGFDEKLVHRLSGGRFLKNRQDTLLIAYSLLNDSKQTPKLSLKELTKSAFGTWSDKEHFDITNLQLSDVDNVYLQYYAGIDACACLHYFNKHKDAIKATPSVDIFDILPTEHPSKRTHSRYWFYKNVARAIIPVTIEMMNTGLPLNMDNVHKLDSELDSILGTADTEVLQLPTVLKCWEQFKENKAQAKVEKYKEGVDSSSVKIYKPTNQVYINLFVRIKYPTKELPSKAKNWTPTVIATFDAVLAQAIKDKNLESLRTAPKYANIFEEVETILTNQKVQEKQAKIEETAASTYHRAILDLEFKPLASAQQKKFIFKEGFKLSAINKSMITGEDSFNKEELNRLIKTLPEGTELYKYVELCLTYSGGAIVKNNFVKNFKEFVHNGRIHSDYRIGSTKSFRAASGGKLNLLNLPSSASVFAKPIKKCISVPNDEWAWLTLDYQALEVSVSASVSGDEVLLKALREGFDMHCNNSAAYFKEEIESILGVNDGSIEWNKKYKEATKTNARLDKLRSMSKPVTFSLTYLASVPGLYKAVGYLGSTFEDQIKVQGYKFTTDVTLITGFKGGTYYAADRDAEWFDVEDYKLLDSKYHEFFEQAVLPAKRMHYTYHNELYYGLKSYREDSVLPEAKKYKNVHLGLGLHINQTTKLNMASIRTLNNVIYQGFSMLSLIALEKFRRIVYDKNYQDRVQIVSSIYDSVYVLVKRDPELIKWAAAELTKQMEVDYLVDQPMKLSADAEISLTDWSNFCMLDDVENLNKFLSAN